MAAGAICTISFLRPPTATKVLQRAWSMRVWISLKPRGFLKSHIDVFTSNGAAMEFWQKIGWQRRADIVRYSFIRGGGENA